MKTGVFSCFFLFPVRDSGDLRRGRVSPLWRSQPMGLYNYPIQTTRTVALHISRKKYLKYRELSWYRTYANPKTRSTTTQLVKPIYAVVWFLSSLHIRWSASDSTINAQQPSPPSTINPRNWRVRYILGLSWGPLLFDKVLAIIQIRW